MQLTADKVVKWSDKKVPDGLTLEKAYFGRDEDGLGGFQVALASAASVPSRPALKELYAVRKGKTQTQLVVAVENGQGVYLYGPDPQAQPIELPSDLAQRQLQSVLNEPNMFAAVERMAGFRKAHDSTDVPGFTNSALFATHHLKQNVPQRADWADLNKAGYALLNRRGHKLIEALGFQSKSAGSGAYLLSTGSHAPRVAAVLLEEDERFDAKSNRFQLSPVAYGLAVASGHEVPWLIVLRKDQIRLYPGRDGVGVGSKGQAETYFEIDLSTVDTEFAGLLPLIFSAGALAAGGTADQLLRDSAKFATALGKRLRERIYEEIVPPVAVEVAQQLARSGHPLDADGLATAYRVTLRILFRLLFQAYAEDRGLLPSGRNEGFDANSLKTNAARLLGACEEEFGEAATIWKDLEQVWEAIDIGNRQWQVPTYNGGLFSTDPARSPEGALIARIKVPDRVLGPALKHLLIDTSEDGHDGPVDFRSLSVREFGTIYEGLLESSLSLAEQDLTIDTKGAWVPAKKGDEVYAPAGSVYFHTASGERKATGAYFTPKVVVDHLIERSIVPALKAHLDKIAALLESGDAPAAARDFFDFRVADLAMGSGHFLVAAVDKIEALMRTFLTKHTVPGVTEELLRLAGVAKEALGTDEVAKSEVDEIGLLRRQVARRCIYGLDINPMAVELARLALWIHTFVPGLPMSNLDHGLVNASSLTGVATVAEALDALQPGRKASDPTLFDAVLNDQLTTARGLLLDLGDASEANKAEVDQSAHILASARSEAETARRIFDAAVAVRAGVIDPSAIMDEDSLEQAMSLVEVQNAVAQLVPAHFPFLFPEVFLREANGFDAIVGNPPWDKVRWEAVPYWSRISPGLVALPADKRDEHLDLLRAERPVEAAREQVEMAERESLQDYFKKVFPWRGGTHLELAQLMLERALKATKHDGGIGLVLPRQALVLAGWKTLRKKIFERHSAMFVQARNAGGWIFEGVHASYAVVLLALGPFTGEPTEVAVVTSEVELRSLGPEAVIRLTLPELRSLSDTMVVPWFNTPGDKFVFDKLRAFPRLSSRSGWVHGTHDARWDFRGSGPDRALARRSAAPPESWRVMMTRHVDAFALRDTEYKQFIPDVAAVVAKGRGVEQQHGDARCGKRHPVVIFRHPSRSDDTRTLIAAGLPDEGYLYNKGYIHAVAHAEETPELVLLALIGLLNTNTEDWWARRFVDRHVTAPVINNLPVPAFTDAEVAEMGERAAVLLRRNGFETLAGDIDVAAISRCSRFSDESTEVLLASMEALTARGYGLTTDDLAVVRGDFRDKKDEGMPQRRFELASQFLISGKVLA